MYNYMNFYDFIKLNSIKFFLHKEIYYIIKLVLFNVL